MLREFKDFLMKGNIVDLAVAFVIGVAFAAVVNSFVNDLIMPLIAMIIGKPNFNDLTFTINDAVFHYGSFITARDHVRRDRGAVFFFVVKPMDAIKARMQGRGGDDLRRGAPPPGAARRVARARHVVRRQPSSDTSAAAGERTAEALVEEDEPHAARPRMAVEVPRRRHRRATGAASSGG